MDINFYKSVAVPKVLFPIQAIVILLALVALVTTGPGTNMVGGKSKGPASQTGDGGEPAGGGEPAPQNAPGVESPPPGPAAQPTNAAAQPGPPAPEPEGDARATRPGIYRYHSKWTSSGGSQGPQQDERDISVQIATVSETPQEVRQTLKYMDGGGAEFEVLWKADSITVPKMTIGGQYECDWEPDLLQYAQPVQRGASWKTDTSCTANYQGQQGRTEHHEQARVIGTEKIQIAGATVDAFVIERNSTSDTTVGVTSYKTEKTTKEWWSVRHAITLRQTDKSKSTSTQGTFESTYDIELLNLAPE